MRVHVYPVPPAFTSLPMPARPLRCLALLSLLLLAACGGPPPYTGGNVPDLQRIEVSVGEGRPATTGDTVRVHYTGWLYDQNAPGRRGTKFDSSRDRGQPFSFELGAGRVIRGWDEGVAGMRVGGKRELHIPAFLGYGAAGAGRAIPPGASLVFEVELLEIRK
jgi:FKBP-type peptidyl-prolyl cis-trans isomerase FkpA